MEKKLNCRCCRQKKLFKYLNLGSQPLANSYHIDEKLPLYPLEVMVCKNCFHSQLSVVVDKDAMFRNYLYVSGTTKTFQEHTRKLAEDAVGRFKKGKLLVLDIACNDGTQLEHFRTLKCDVVGVDPAENLRKITKSKNIPVVVDYWTEKVAKKLKKKFNIITGTNVFAHVNDLDEFLRAAKIALDPDGLLILEFPYADKMIEHNEFDTVYHEHLSYFLVNSFSTLAGRLGFHIIDIIQTPIHGGSIRFFLKAGEGKNAKIVDRLIRKESNKGLLEINSYKEFNKRVVRNKKIMRNLLDRLRLKKEKVVGYGASAKGNTMLNYFKINLSYIVDDNRLKWGYKTPGRNILIKPPDQISEEKGDLYIVILSWNFYNEIVKKVLNLKRGSVRVHFILYVPTIKVLTEKNIKKFSISA